MASRWRTWDGEAHVDSHGLPPKHSPRFEPVRHSFDWDDVPELLKAFVVPEDLSRRIGESNAATKYEMQGILDSASSTHTRYSSIRGRAETLRMRLGARLPGTLTAKKKKDSITKQDFPVDKDCSSQVANGTEDFVPDKQTIYFKHLPNNITEKELIGSVELFGKVTTCMIFRGDTESTGYVRLEEHSACDWVISYFRGMPYDDISVPLECDYAIEHTYS